jgi:hypothetical protein
VARPQNATAPADAGEMPPSRPIGSRTELPPLKLSGEDDE